MMTKTERLVIRLETDEKKLIELAASQEYLAATTWARQTLLKVASEIASPIPPAAPVTADGGEGGGEERSEK